MCLFLVRTQAEDISTFSGNALSGFPATDVGHTSRNVNINCDVFLLNFVGATATISNNSAQKLVISSTITKVKNLLLVSSTSTTALEANSTISSGYYCRNKNGVEDHSNKSRCRT